VRFHVDKCRYPQGLSPVLTGDTARTWSSAFVTIWPGLGSDFMNNKGGVISRTDGDAAELASSMHCHHDAAGTAERKGLKPEGARLGTRLDAQHESPALASPG
jgi:hypothetical protein